MEPTTVALHKLDDHQLVMAQTLITRYEGEDFNFAQILPADTGCGKTHIAAHVLHHFKDGFKAFVLCPKNLVSMWDEILKSLNVPILSIMSYNKLSGKTNTGVKHPFLILKNGVYQATAEWKKQKGVFCVCDESQSVKNKKSKRHAALFALLQANTKVKVLHLTASMQDKRDHWVTLYRNMGLIRHTRMLKRKDGVNKYKHYGLGDVLNQVPNKLLEKVLRKYDIMTKWIPEILMYLWIEYFRERLVIPVTDIRYRDPVTQRPYNKSLLNHFVTLDKAGQSLVKEAIQNLRINNVIDDDDKVNVQAAMNNFAQVQLMLMKVCRAKINTIVNMTQKRLDKTNEKIIIVCPYIESQKLLQQKLIKYQPLLLNGKVKHREEVINKFNAHTTEYRCLILSNEMGEGISLHDTHGQFPRRMYIIPTYNFLKTFQCAGRPYRRGILSDCAIHIIYSNDGLLENVLVNALSKTEIANSILIPGSGRVYPGNYDYLIEKCPQEAALKMRLEEEREKVKSI